MSVHARNPPGSQARTVRSARSQAGSQEPTIRASRVPPDPQEATASEPQPGRSDAPMVLDRYRLRRRLGTGGFATVWHAYDERLDREVAIKILPRERVAEGRFEREARVAARLAHPGIVTLYEAAVDDEGAYLVSELVHGVTLDRLLQAGRLSDRDIVQIGIALCDALAHAHDQGVIHRDVKPSNVLIPERPTTPAQLARLTDFGVARVLDGDSLTRTGDVIGTAAYMAPEQAEGLVAAAPADLFSLALVLYEALTGVNPVRTSLAAGGTRRLGMHLPPLRRQRRELPRELGQTIDLALRPRPRERGRIEEMRAALAGVAGRVDDEPGVVSGPSRPRTRARQAGGPSTDELHLRIEDHRRRADAAARGEPLGPEVDRHDPADLPRDRRQPDDPPGSREKAHIPWPRRALAGVLAAGLTAWLARHAPGSSPIPTALAACIAGVLVAALPRSGWLALTAFIATSLLTTEHAGGAVLLLAGALIPVVLMPRDGPAWPLAVVAPALGAIGLATAWPAIAGMTRSAWRRGALAVTGWLWLALARGPWTASLSATVHQAFVPLLTVGTLVGCGAWAVAAVVLPWARLRSSALLEGELLAGWAIGLGVATITATQLGSGDPPISAGAAFLGGFAGALVALVTRRSWRRVRSARSAKGSAATA